MTIRSDDTAHCRQPGIDTDWFFPPTDDANTPAIKRAKDTCTGCPFSGPCLDYSLRNMVDGIWAGTTRTERTAMRRKLRIVAEPLSFGTGPTNASTAKRMAGRGTPVSTIAAHLGVTPEAVHRILRISGTPSPEPRGSKGVAQLATCPDCGTEMRRSSLGRHRREVCRGRGQVAS